MSIDCCVQCVLVDFMLNTARKIQSHAKDRKKSKEWNATDI